MNVSSFIKRIQVKRVSSIGKNNTNNNDGANSKPTNPFSQLLSPFKKSTTINEKDEENKSDGKANVTNNSKENEVIPSGKKNELESNKPSQPLNQPITNNKTPNDTQKNPLESTEKNSPLPLPTVEPPQAKINTPEELNKEKNPPPPPQTSTTKVPTPELSKPISQLPPPPRKTSSNLEKDIIKYNRMMI